MLTLRHMFGRAKAAGRLLGLGAVRRSLTPAVDTVFMRDIARIGWHNDATGELYPGYTVAAEDTYVDVGCGDGAACMFAARRGAEVIGVDIVPELIENLRHNFRRAHARQARALLSDGDPLPIESGVASRVVCQEVLEHVPDPARFMSELVRVGRSGARYFLTVPDSVGEDIQKRLAPESYWRPPNHVRIFRREDFARLVVDSGLRIEKRASDGFYRAVWWTLFWGTSKPIPFGRTGGSKQLRLWNSFWDSLIKDPKYASVVEAFESLMPKTQVIIAVKD